MKENIFGGKKEILSVFIGPEKIQKPLNHTMLSALNTSRGSRLLILGDECTSV